MCSETILLSTKVWYVGAIGMSKHLELPKMLISVGCCQTQRFNIIIFLQMTATRF